MMFVRLCLKIWVSLINVWFTGLIFDLVVEGPVCAAGRCRWKGSLVVVVCCLKVER